MVEWILVLWIMDPYITHIEGFASKKECRHAILSIRAGGRESRPGSRVSPIYTAPRMACVKRTRKEVK